jgi:hypothetical protein
VLCTLLCVVLQQTFTGQATPGAAANTASTAEDAQQAFLSRVLLLLGSFVVICLLCF